MNKTKLAINDEWIFSHREKKNPVDPVKPYGWVVEKERTSSGIIENVGTIFLTNTECPFRCVMCDLWKNTTDVPLSIGQIPQQIKWALQQMPRLKHIKLYNSGSFFDPRAIPVEDYEKIAIILSNFETVIVESHPKFINQQALYFNSLLKSELQIAIGLETAVPQVLQKINKKMTLYDFQNAVGFLLANGIKSRAFILLKPPFQNEQEGILWAKRSIDFAFETGVECCTVIPVRGGNGAMEKLIEAGMFSPPAIDSLEAVLEYGISLNKGRVFADLWDLNLFSNNDRRFDQKYNRLNEMNLNQQIINPLSCMKIQN